MSTAATVSFVRDLVPPVEERIPIGRLARELGLNASTIWRWAARGVRGAKLNTTVVGGRTYVTREALQRFLAAIQGDGAPTPSPAQMDRDRRRRVEAARRELSSMGLGGEGRRRGGRR